MGVPWVDPYSVEGLSEKRSSCDDQSRPFKSNRCHEAVLGILGKHLETKRYDIIALQEVPLMTDSRSTHPFLKSLGVLVERAEGWEMFKHDVAWSSQGALDETGNYASGKTWFRVGTQSFPRPASPPCDGCIELDAIYVVRAVTSIATTRINRVVDPEYIDLGEGSASQCSSCWKGAGVQANHYIVVTVDGDRHLYMPADADGYLNGLVTIYNQDALGMPKTVKKPSATDNYLSCTDDGTKDREQARSGRPASPHAHTQ